MIAELYRPGAIFFAADSIPLYTTTYR